MKLINSLILYALIIPLNDINATSVNIVPAPLNMSIQEQFFHLSSDTEVLIDKQFSDSVNNSELQKVLSYFTGSIKRFNGIGLIISNSDDIELMNPTNTKAGRISIIYDAKLAEEEYSITSKPDEINISASRLPGLFYAFQTLRLSIPLDNMSMIPLINVKDKPRFEYRGLMLDVSRFFIPKEDLMNIIDCMSVLKLNRLHLHLTDDNGWRLEIKKYPKLTSVGAWRVNRTDVPFPDRRNAEPGEPTPIGGFYTQEDMKEIISFAQTRQVEIIPEIDVPGHSNAALAAYPDMACPSVDRYISVVPGMGQGSGSIIFCAGNEKSFSFLQDVIDEVAAIFPSKYIHIGGDEAWKDYWKKCPLCNDRMKKEGLSHIEDLQSYFMKRISSYVQSKGKQVMGWDELTNSELPDGSIIFGWRGMGNAALKAADQGHKFIMTPAKVVYLIRYQGPQWFEPLTYFGNNTLKDVYNYEPVQLDWKKEYESLLMGVQASLWTEFCDSPKDVYHQIFPRLAALSEVAWSPKGKKDWDGFIKSLDNYLWYLKASGINYSSAMFNIQHKSMSTDDGRIKIELECERPDVKIRYTLNGMEPTKDSPEYTEPVILSKSLSQSGRTELRCATFKNSCKKGETLVLNADWNLATGKRIISENPGDKVLTNGIRGSRKQSDFEWTDNYTKDDTSFTVDLGSKHDIHCVTLGCLTHYAMGVNKPKSITIEVSSDGNIYRQVSRKNFKPEEIFVEGNFIEDVSMDIAEGKNVRFIRITTSYPGDCPSDHIKPNQQSRCRFDEVIVR